jgi:AcrR family transcriptional regulator
MSQRSNKKSQLINAAFQLFQEHPFQAATLAMLAEKADIPLGNIYYYFKSKELLLDAVIDFYIAQMRSRLVECQKQLSSKARLKMFLQLYLNDGPTICQWGDPLFSLSRCLSGEPAAKIQELLDLIQKWAIQQYSHDPQPSLKGLAFLQRLYGIIMIASIQKNPTLYQKNMQQFINEFEQY